MPGFNNSLLLTSPRRRVRKQTPLLSALDRDWELLQEEMENDYDDSGKINFYFSPFTISIDFLFEYVDENYDLNSFAYDRFSKSLDRDFGDNDQELDIDEYYEECNRGLRETIESVNDIFKHGTELFVKFDEDYKQGHLPRFILYGQDINRDSSEYRDISEIVYECYDQWGR